MGKKLFIWILLLAALSITCDRDKNPVSPDQEKFVYPIKIGNQWEYKRKSFSNNFRPNVENFSQDTTVSSVVIKITKEHILEDSTKTFVFYETLNENGHEMTDESYYANSKDGLYFYGYKNAGTLIPKMSQTNKIHFNGYYFKTVEQIADFVIKVCPNYFVNADTVIYENPPLLVLAYPIQMNKVWVYRKPGQPWHISKKIIGNQVVDVPAGKFSCLKIQWLYDMDNNSKWDENIIFFDYICDKGLVKRDMYFKDIVSTNEMGDELGTFDSTYESVLLKVQI